MDKNKKTTYYLIIVRSAGEYIFTNLCCVNKLYSNLQNCICGN